MDDDDTIKELLRRMDGAKRTGFHVTPGVLPIVVEALRFMLACRGWAAAASPALEWPRAAPAPYTGPLPTIGASRALGMLACHIHCAGLNCHNQRRMTFDELGVPDTAAFVDIPRLRRFMCQRCGPREVTVSA